MTSISKEDIAAARRLWDKLCALQDEWHDWHACAVRGDGYAGPMPSLGDDSVASIAAALSRSRHRGARKAGTK